MFVSFEVLYFVSLQSSVSQAVKLVSLERRHSLPEKTKAILSELKKGFFKRTSELGVAYPAAKPSVPLIHSPSPSPVRNWPQKGRKEHRQF